MNTSSRKELLRHQLRAERQAFDSGFISTSSAIIRERVRFRVKWRNIKNLHCYTTITELNEVNLDDFVVYALHHQPHVNVYSSQKIAGEWRTVHISPDGIRDLEDELPVLDTVIVPMLGFDSSLNRLGYGVGYYDRFLAGQPQAKKIGVCFEQGRFDELPVEQHDIPMDMIITEEHVYFK